VLAEQGLRHQAIDVGAITIGSVVLFLLVVLRMSGLVAQVQDQAAQVAALAHNDMLIGIPNRRAWELELPREMARVRRQGGQLCGQESPERLIGRADVGLYEAKRAGRDRVVVTPSQAAAAARGAGQGAGALSRNP
jgi:predicted signal transduction protein with EAL and GGDEF domain